MTTTSQAFDAIVARLVASGTTLPLRYQGENGLNNDPPVDDLGRALPFVLVDFDVHGHPTGGPDAFGGGQGANLYRNPSTLTLYVLVPQGEGLKSATDKAEVLAPWFRSHRDSDISCFAATVRPGGKGSSLAPPGVDSAVDNYFWAAVEVDMHFTQIG